MGRKTALAALVLSLAGCHTVELSKDARARIASVQVGATIEEHGSYAGALPQAGVESRGAAWYVTWLTAPIGVVLDLVFWSEHAAAKEVAFEGLMRENGVSVADIVRSTLTEQLAGDAGFRIVPSGADAELRIAIDYGLSDGMGARGSWKPWLEVSGVLVGPGEELLWRRRARISSYDDRLPELQQPFDPERLRGAFRRAARLVTRELVGSLGPRASW